MPTADFLTSGPLSLDEIISAIRAQSLDTNAKPVFSDTEIKLAIRQAILNSHGKFFTTDTTTISFTSGDFDYTLGADVQRIVLVTRAKSGVTERPNSLSGTSPDEVVTGWRHLKKPGANTLYFTRDYSDSTMTIWFERDVQVPVDSRELSASLTAAATTMTLTDADPQLYRIALPAYFRINDEIVKMTAISGNTSSTIARAQLSTTAAAHSEGDTLSQMVMADTDRFFNFLFQDAGRLLNEFRVQAGSQSVSVAANVTAARMFKDNRESILREIPQTRRVRKMHFSRTRRPRRDF